MLASIIKVLSTFTYTYLKYIDWLQIVSFFEMVLLYILMHTAGSKLFDVCLFVCMCVCVCV